MIQIEAPLQTPTEAEPATAAAQLETLKTRLEPLYARLAAHPLYRSFRTLDDLRHFMQSHVFAVWDFMSLLKALQTGLTHAAETPWLPTPDASSRRLINDLVLVEEADLYPGPPLNATPQHPLTASHFELYLEAMHAAGASTATMREVLDQIRLGTPVAEAMAIAPPAAQVFVAETFRTLATGKLHAIAAAFTFGREDLIPEIFRGFLRDQDTALSGQLALFRWYLDRHVEVDGEEHGPMALQMVSNLCGSDETMWQEATQAAVQAVEARLAFWDAIAAELIRRRPA